MTRSFSNTDELLTHTVFRNFAKICEIPHPSFHEEKISEYLYNWAKERSLDVTRDKSNNIFIRKAATKGYEDAPAILLQAHMDMVCVKSADSDHDFINDPITMVLDGDILSTGGKTTLGADDGIGMSYALSVLESDTLEHPPIEALFTTSEEEDMGGALNFDTSLLKAKYLINLDHAVDSEILTGSCGGIGIKTFHKLEKTVLPSDWSTFDISIRGLKGGHSGEDIHRGHGNASILLGRFMAECVSKFPVLLSYIKGGTFRLAIPSYADATISAAPSDITALKDIAREMSEIFAKEYEATAPDFTLTLKEADRAKSAVSYEDTKKLITTIILSPDGISEMNGGVPGTVESSDNMGEMYMEGDTLIIIYEIRASFKSTQEYLVRKITTLTKMMGAEYETFSAYPGWAFSPVSPLRETALRIYKEKYGSDMTVTVVHAGLEVGCFIEGKSDLDAISIGPNCWYFHSPSECTSVSSVCKTWDFLCALLAEGRSLPK